MGTFNDPCYSWIYPNHREPWPSALSGGSAGCPGAPRLFGVQELRGEGVRQGDQEGNQVAGLAKSDVYIFIYIYHILEI